MVTELLIASIAFGTGSLFTLGILFIGWTLGRISKGMESGLQNLVPDLRTERYTTDDNDEQVLDDEYFRKAQLTTAEGGHGFPSDDELAFINRHSGEE